MTSTAMVELNSVLSVGVESICAAIATNTIRQAEINRQDKLEQTELQVRSVQDIVTGKGI